MFSKVIRNSMSYPDVYRVPKNKGSSNLVQRKKGSVLLSDQQWKDKLTHQQYHVLRQKATEPPSMGKFPETFDDHFAAGVYFCAGCLAAGYTTPLYSSGMKYDCRCGWPGFWTNVKGSVYKQMSGPITQCGCKAGQPDLRMVEILCSRCDGHLGHVYNGEANGYCTGERHCVNSLALAFVPRGGGDVVLPRYKKFLRTMQGGCV
mmetsp:Transcript_160279/g.282759  ORF Transcript_160279/g.282759 Transcript_160279/m.282759 type:complete len:204 (-) Transcript_160279:64-675(-)